MEIGNGISDASTSREVLRERPACLSSLFALNGDQLHVKNERLIGTNGPAARSARPISEIGGNVELPLRSNGHELQRLRPTLDHAADLKLGRLAALVGAVKLCSVDQPAAVIANHRIAGGGFCAGAGCEYFVLQAAGQRDDAVLCLIGCQKIVGFLHIAL